MDHEQLQLDAARGGCGSHTVECKMEGWGGVEWTPFRHFFVIVTPVALFTTVSPRSDTAPRSGTRTLFLQ